MNYNKNQSQTPLSKNQNTSENVDINEVVNFLRPKENNPAKKLQELEKGTSYKITGWKKVEKPKYKAPKEMETSVILELGDINVWAPIRFAAAKDSYLDCLVQNEANFVYHGKKNGYHDYDLKLSV